MRKVVLSRTYNKETRVWRHEDTGVEGWFHGFFNEGSDGELSVCAVVELLTGEVVLPLAHWVRFLIPLSEPIKGILVSDNNG